MDAGDLAASEELMPIVYDELRRIASRLMQSQGRAHTMQPTELIHEAYLRLVDDDETDHDRKWEGRLHFTRVAARAMRFVLVDHARGKLAKKRGGERHRVTLDTRVSAIADNAEQVLFVHDGLDRLAAVDEQLAKIVELRFFGGMTMDEIANSLESSTRTVERGWRVARAWWIKEFGEVE
jgi:RNA polymerase sigma factor (TIGR02999 family)